MALSLKVMLSPISFRFSWLNNVNHFYSNHVNSSEIALHGIFSFLFGAIMMFISYKLYKRVKIAWIATIIFIFLIITIQIFHFHEYRQPIIFIEIFVITTLLLSIANGQYLKDHSKGALRGAILLLIISFLIICVGTSFDLYINKTHSFITSVLNSIAIFVFTDKSVWPLDSLHEFFFLDVFIIINWVCIISAIVLLLNPVVRFKSQLSADSKSVRNMVLKYGQNPLSYLALEEDKKYFFSEKIEGVVAYTIISEVFVCCGDIICAKEDAPIFLGELLSFCKEKFLDLILINVTETFIDLYKGAGFGVTKYGEDACFLLSEYNLSGGKSAKVRAAINSANKKGIEVFEYLPNEKRDELIESQIDSISKEWLINKNSGEMGFMIGGTNLHSPMDRRYFYAMDPQSNMLGFVVFIPYFCQGGGYLADVTRRRSNAPQGVLEKIIYESFMKFKDEGYTWGSMGLAPLVNVKDDSIDTLALTETLFNYIYENLNSFYDFKALYHSKKKFGPTHWQPRYTVYNSKIFKPAFAYAIVKSQYPSDLKDILFPKVTNK